MTNNGKDTRNYWRKHDKNGNRINIIFVDGVEVEVSDEIYATYSKMDRRMRYEEERDTKKKQSFDVICETGDMRLLCNIILESAEDTFLQRLDEEEKQRLIKKLLSEVKRLPHEEKWLIDCLYWKCISLREAARSSGIAVTTLHYRHQMILKKLGERIIL